MKLKQIIVKNFRSIEEQTFIIDTHLGDATFTLIGINESGKSSFLSAIALVDGHGDVAYPRDFFDRDNPIEIYLRYELEQADEKRFKEKLADKGFDNAALKEVTINSVDVCVVFPAKQATTREVVDKISFKKRFIKGYKSDGARVTKIDNKSDEKEQLDLEAYFSTNLPNHFWSNGHYIIFWKSDAAHLINDEIPLETFATDPEKVSVPLKNCFELAGIENIPTEVARIKNNPSETNNLQEKLSDKVTAHIKNVWAGHKVKIRFQIDNMKISLLVEDEKVRYSAKTTSQRSDGFRQFISFLLTISAESRNKILSNSILLLDEPETHLHPKAQECLKNELIKITESNNNIVFYATHSNYMIDKNHIYRSYRVTKEGNRRTVIEKINGSQISYSEVNYEVFDIVSTDYHNELYGFLEDTSNKLGTLPKTKTWINKKHGHTEKVSLATYIRHSIHHPENTLNAKFTEAELLESIKTLRALKYS